MSDLRELPLFPLNTVLFPGMSLPLHIFEERYKLMIGRCIEQSSPFGVVMIRSGEEIDPSATIHEVGTTAHITQVERLPGGRMNVATLGYKRFRVVDLRYDEPYLVGMIEDYPLLKADAPEVKELAGKLMPILQGYLDIFATLGNVDVEMEPLPSDPATLAFLTAIILRTPMKEKQDLLAKPDLLDMLRSEYRLLHRESQILKMLVSNGLRSREDSSPFSPN